MGNCQYCGKPAGLLRSKHPECEDEHWQRERLIQAGRQQVTAEVSQAIKGAEGLDRLEQRLLEIERTFFVPPSDRKDLLIKGWEDSVEQFLNDGVLDATEEARLVEFRDRFALSQTDLDRSGAFTRIAKAAILRDVLNRVLPQRVSLAGDIAINFQKSEHVVWAFSGSGYLEDKTRRQYVGRSQGMSVRVMKGVYYRIGAFKGHPVEYTERVHVDTGAVVLTTKNIYFAGPRKSFRIPYAKVVSFEPFSDGIGLMRDSATAKPQVLVTGDGWFTYNLVTNLSQM